MAEPRDTDAQLRRTAELQRTVIGAAPVTAGATATAVFDTAVGGDFGAMRPRDPGDGSDRLSPENSAELTGGAPTRAEEVLGSDEDTNPDQISAALRHEDETGG